MSETPILITGASGGIGTAVTEYLLRAGHRNLVCHYRSKPERIRAILQEYELNPERRLVQADLTSEEDVRRLHVSVLDACGPVGGIVNLAGGSSNGMAWKLGREEFQKVMDMNVLTTFLVCRQFIPAMRERGSGRIINVSSVAAYMGVPGAAHYCAAKAAVIGFSRALALELAPKNVVVSVIALGYFQYGLIDSVSEDLQGHIKARIPLQRFGRGNELGALIEYLLSDAGSYCAGQVYHLNGGLYS